MDQPLTGHPAADGITPAAVITEQTRRIVPRSAWLADAAVTAARQGREFQLVTPPESRITYPLELMLTETGGRWVVRPGDIGSDRLTEGPANPGLSGFEGLPYPGLSGFEGLTGLDGLTGEPLYWNNDHFAPLPGTRPATPLAPGAVWDGSAEIQITTLHAADATLELGATTEAAVRGLTGHPPAGWGVAEPVTQPWSRRELTTHCRTRAPAPTSVVIVGNGVVGVVNIKRVRNGVLEEVRLSGPPFLSAGESAYETLAGEVAATARSMLISVHHGRIDGLRSSLPTLPSLPYGILIAPADSSVPAGPPSPIPGRGTGGGARWYRLDDGPGQPYEALTEVLRSYGLPAPTRSPSHRRDRS